MHTDRAARHVTLAAALGAKALAKLDVLPTRLSAVDEAASIDVLCMDKTGTLTLNALSVTAVRAMPGFNEARVLGLAVLASPEGGQDPVDAAIRAASAKKGSSDLPNLVKFVPFDPTTKMSEAQRLIRTASRYAPSRSFRRSVWTHSARPRCIQNRRRTGQPGLPCSGCCRWVATGAKVLASLPSAILLALTLLL